MEGDILEQLYQKYAKQVYLYLFSLCRRHALAEDLMQETFLKAFCSLEMSGERVLPWLLRVARNLYLDVWRKEIRYMSHKEIEWDDLVSDRSISEGLLEKMIEKEQNRVLYQNIQKLRNPEKEAVILYYFAGLSQEEISRLLQLSYGNTRVVLYRAKQKLREMMKEDKEEM